MADYYTPKYKRKRRKKPLLILFGAIIILLTFIVIYFEANVNRVLVSVSEATVEAMTNTAVNEAVFETLASEAAYKDLVKIERNEAGDIVAFTADSLKINALARKTAAAAQNNLQSLCSGGVKIPLGAFTGIEILSGTGPRLKVKIVPIGNVVCRFTSRFASVGINQTLHSIYLDVETSVNIILASRSEEVVGCSQVLVAESVIVGKVPEVYLNGDIFGNGFDLAPNSGK